MHIKGKGITLIELIIVMVIVGMLAVMASILLKEAIKANLASDNEIVVKWKAQNVLRRMAREMRFIRAANAESLTCTQSNEITFTNLDGVEIKYLQVGGELKRQENQGTSYPIMQEVSQVTFTCLDSAYQPDSDPTATHCIRINITISNGGISVPLETTICPRNF